ncbi:MAG: HlyD family efflux transporter periplasmic adaptor subunit [Betaproteobacteria bacterium]|nr:HlyD family efflux transporter periplasmic adaptor subunit [Betaproteobacteria bacterium]
MSEAEQQPSPPPVRQRKRRRALTGIAIVVLIAGMAGGAWWWWVARWEATTNDAYVSTDISEITALTPGTVKAVHVHAGQQVHAGDLLVELDDTDARLALAQATAELGKAVRGARGLGSNVLASEAVVAQRVSDLAAARSQLESAEVTLSRARSELARQTNLAAQGFISQDALEAQKTAVATAEAAKATAKGVVAAAEAAGSRARAELEGSLAQVAGSALEGLPDVASAIAHVRAASLALARTRILAPVDGIATTRSAHLGDHVEPGSPVVSVVPLDGVWVDANFKETSLTDLRVGQPVELTSDVYGSSVVYHGRVAGIGPATGSALSLLPAQNATGNWIKVVQRVPVRIWLDPEALHDHPLQVGLSMDVTVDVHDRSGPRLGLLTDAAGVQRSDVYDRITSEAEAQAAKIITSALRARTE